MVKIAVIFPSDPLGEKIGGAHTYIKDIIKFAPEDFEIEFIGITSNNIARPQRKRTRMKLGPKEFDFYPLYFEKGENKKSFIPSSLRFSLALKLAHLEFRNKILFLNRIEPALFLINIKTPKVGVVHNDIREQMSHKGSEVLWSLFPWLYFKIEGIIFESLDHVYSESCSAIKFYHQKFPDQNEKFSFLPTWADRDIYSPSQESKTKLRQSAYFLEKHLLPDKKWILFAGRLQEQKAPLRLVDAFFEYHKINQESCLIIVGDGNLRAGVERHIKELSLQKDVFLIGQAGKIELVNFYRASDCSLLTSNFEGMPLAVLEALGCGLPVVSTRVGEVERVIRNGYSGEVRDTFDPKDLAQGLERVLNNPEIYKKDNCINAVKEYTPENVLKPVYEMMRKLYRKNFSSEKK